VKRILKYVFERKRAYNKLPLFEWMRDESLSPRERLAFYPAMAPFILSFGDLNKFVLRKEANGDRFQEMVNQHTLEDDHHWPWYLEDFSKLGFDDAARGTQWMRFLWGDETLQNRVLMARLTALIEPATGLERLAIVEGRQGPPSFSNGTVVGRNGLGPLCPSFRRMAPRRHQCRGTSGLMLEATGRRGWSS
jgi:hypothetical protein